MTAMSEPRLGAEPGGLELGALEQFVYREARLADAHDYDAWEALWTDDALYWVPAGGADTDPRRQVSVIYDNRRRIATRLAQLRTGRRHAQSPPSNLARLVSNIELLRHDGGDALVTAVFTVVEFRSGRHELWAGRAEYRIREMDGELRLAGKKVVLVNCDEALPTLSFLI